MKLRGANVLLDLPDREIDGHAHVFERTLKLAPGRRYAPANDALLSTYVQHLQDHQLTGALLVQPSFLGTDNTYLLAAMAAGNGLKCTGTKHADDTLALRGVVTLSPDTQHDEMSRLHEAGIRGVRFNLYGKPTTYRFDIEPWLTVIRRADELGWHIDVHCEGALLASVLPMLLTHSHRITVDHFGLPDPTAPMECPGQAAILEAPKGHVFVKASGPYRAFRNSPSSEAAVRCTPIFTRLLEELGPDQLMWGSDWPWTQFENRHNFSSTRQWLFDWLHMARDRDSYRAPDFARAGDNSRDATTIARPNIRS